MGSITGQKIDYSEKPAAHTQQTCTPPPAPLSWLNLDSFPPRPVVMITSGIINTKFDRRLQPPTADLSIITFCRSRSYSYGSEGGLKVSDYCIQSGREPQFRCSATFFLFFGHLSLRRIKANCGSKHKEI